MLRNKFAGGDAGKAGAGACAGLLMKVLMYQAVPGVPSEKWEQLMEIGRYFVDGAPMSMSQMLRYDERYNGEDWEALRKRLWFKPQELCAETDPYEGPDFQIATLKGAYSYEYLDAYNNPLGTIDNYKMWYLNQFYNAGEFCKGSVFEIVHQESADGSSGDTNEGSYIYESLFSASSPLYCTDQIRNSIFGNDVRRDFTIGHHEYTPDNENTEIGGPIPILSLKWYTPIKDRPLYSGDNSKNRRYMRYIEVVLMYAEGLNECGHGQEAIDQLNGYKRVLNKLNNSSTLYNGGGYGVVRDQIWNERRMELCFEFDRFFDIVRQGRAKALLHKFALDYTVNQRGMYFREGVNEIFPIPQTEIDVSNGVVTQNPGY